METIATLGQVSEVELTYKSKVKNSERIKIQTSQDIYSVLKSIYKEDQMEHIECMYVILLNRANKCLGWYKLSQGGITGTMIDKRVIFQLALLGNATSLIISHNHPSGNLQPSNADIKVTKEVADAGRLLDIPLLDHLIVTSESYYSFADEGML